MAHIGPEGFPCSSVGKESACSAGDLGSIPGLGRSPGEENGNPFQYPCLENLMDRRAWGAAVHGVTKSRTRLSDWTELNTLQYSCLENSIDRWVWRVKHNWATQFHLLRLVQLSYYILGAWATLAVITHPHGVSHFGLFCIIYLSLSNAKSGLKYLRWTLVPHMHRIWK